VGVEGKQCCEHFYMNIFTDALKELSWR
jgi:hypothetical protein